jgi:hypothetical protein
MSSGYNRNMSSISMCCQRSESTNPTSFHEDRNLETLGNRTETSKRFTATSPPHSTHPSHHNGVEEPTFQDSVKHKYLESSQANGIPREFSGSHNTAQSAIPSQLSTRSSRSLSPARYIHHPEPLNRFIFSLPRQIFTVRNHGIEQTPQRRRL